MVEKLKHETTKIMIKLKQKLIQETSSCFSISASEIKKAPL